MEIPKPAYDRLRSMPPRRDGKPRLFVVTGEVVNDFGVYDEHGRRIAQNMARQWSNPLYVLEADGSLLHYDPAAEELVPILTEQHRPAPAPRGRLSALALRLAA